MPVSTDFLATCRALVLALPELSTFRTALTTLTNTTREARVAAWNAAYDNARSPSPAYLLHKAIRDLVRAQADISGNMSDLDRESAYRTLSAEFVADTPRPPSLQVERDELVRLHLEDLMR